jgi:hypothetical protein
MGAASRHAAFLIVVAPGNAAFIRKFDENRSRHIGALRIRARRSRRRPEMQRDRKHERAARLLRRGIASESGKARGR